MATTTATLTLTSADLTGDSLALTATTQLKKAGSTVGLDQTSGYLHISIGGSNTAIGRLYAQDWAFFPIDGTLDVDVTTSAAAMTVEYMIIYEA